MKLTACKDCEWLSNDVVSLGYCTCEYAFPKRFLHYHGLFVADPREVNTNGKCPHFKEKKECWMPLPKPPKSHQ